VVAALSDARAEVLARIAAIPRTPAPEAARDYRTKGARSPAARVDRFCERVADYRARVVRVAYAGVSNEIEGICAAHGAVRLGIPAGLRPEWLPSGCELVPEAGLDTSGFDLLDGAVTGCTVAIAETGTIVLTSSPAEGRRALTLVPDLHICAVEHEQIVELVPEAMRRVGAIVRAERRPVTLVSGPSATSDIELSRVEGVHGPRRLVVLVVG